uniref:RmlD-like substrate binding domain-containing protein n=1 Tax=viral metagenome TaxID=1070528 RepID=A0A6C0APD6_9ZZZZ
MNSINLENAIITGGSGMVGLNILFGKKPSSQELNVTNTDQVNEYFDKHKGISCIIHLVALNLRDSEKDPIKAIDTNINGTTNMLNIAKKLNIPFIFVSSGAVFSSFNSNMKFCETDQPSPNCIYGSTKHAAEKIALSYDKTILIRTGWLFGGNQKSHYKFVEHVYNNMINNNSVICCNDFYGSTTYVVDLINKMKELIVNNMFGIHHIVNDGISTGSDIGELIAGVLHKSDSLIDKRTFKDVPNSGPKRSSTEILITNNSFNKLRNWKSALTEYISLLNTRHSETLVSEHLVQKQWLKRDKCRLCNSTNLIDFFNLEPTPPANHFVKQPNRQEKIPLDLAMCDMCNHIQLREILDPSFLYSHYFYVSSTSGVMTKHLKDSVLHFTNSLGLAKDANILEIGANDGVCIKELLDNGFVNVLGIDPANNIHSRHKLPILCDFFGSKSKDKIVAKYKNFKLIYAFHCMAHIEDIKDVFKTIYELLESDGVFIMEVGYFYEVFRTKQFDVIYHEHIDYHTCTAIDTFSRNNGLYLYNVKENNIQGGSIQFYFTKNKASVIDNSVKIAIHKETDLEIFNRAILNKWQFSIEKISLDINSIINSFINSGKKIAAYGASAKSTTFLHQLRISQNTIKYIIDDNIYKQNFYSPGLHIPVKSSEALSLDRVDYIIILSCNFAEEIVARLDVHRKAGLRIIIPFPEIRII